MLYFLRRFFPILIMLVVWACWIIPIWEPKFMSVDFGQQYVEFLVIEEFSFCRGDFSNLQGYSFTSHLGDQWQDSLDIICWALLIWFFIITISTLWPYCALIIWLRYGAIGLSLLFYCLRRYKELVLRSILFPCFIHSM